MWRPNEPVEEDGSNLVGIDPQSKRRRSRRRAWLEGLADQTIVRNLEDVRSYRELELARVRRAKVALIERVSAFGELDPPQLTVTQMIRLLNALDRGRVIVPKPIDASATMPSQEPDRSAEAVRRVLPELRKLDRYERRAAAQRERAVLDLCDKIKYT